jgi:methylmalonyl-CoA/ethylmalonyl-CoA epimerase
MFKVKTIDHVAIAVSDLAPTAAALGQLLGLSPETPENVANQKTAVQFLDTEQPGAAVELICPTGNAGLERFLAKRGPGLHHVCFEVDDLQAALSDLKARGVALIDESPRPGARGHLVAFLHPRSTGGVLFELCQKL